MPFHAGKSSKTSQVRGGSRNKRKKTPKNTVKFDPRKEDSKVSVAMEEEPPTQLGALVMLSPNVIGSPESTPAVNADPLSLNSEDASGTISDLDNDLRSQRNKLPSVFLLERPYKPTLTVPLTPEGDEIVASALYDAMTEVNEKINHEDWTRRHKWIHQWETLRFGHSSSTLRFSRALSTSKEMKQSKVEPTSSTKVPIFTKKTSNSPVLTRKATDSPVLTRMTESCATSQSDLPYLDIVPHSRDPQSSRTIESGSDSGTFKITNYLLNMIIKTRKSHQESTGIKRGAECNLKEESAQKKRLTKTSFQCSPSKRTVSSGGRPSPRKKFTPNKSKPTRNVPLQEPNLTEKRVTRGSTQTVNNTPTNSSAQAAEYDSASSVISLNVDTSELNNVLKTHKKSSRSSFRIYSSEESSENSSIQSTKGVSSSGKKLINELYSSKESICTAAPNEDVVTLPEIEDSSTTDSLKGQDLLVTTTPKEALLAVPVAQSQPQDLLAASTQTVVRPADVFPHVLKTHKESTRSSFRIYSIEESSENSSIQSTKGVSSSGKKLINELYSLKESICTASPNEDVIKLPEIEDSSTADSLKGQDLLVTTTPKEALLAAPSAQSQPQALLAASTQTVVRALDVFPHNEASLPAASAQSQAPLLAASTQSQVPLATVLEVTDSLPTVSSKDQDVLCAASSQSQDSSPAASPQRQTTLLAASLQGQDSSPTVSSKTQDLLPTAFPQSPTPSPTASLQSQTPSLAANQAPLRAASPQFQAPWFATCAHNQAQLPAASAIPTNQPAGVFSSVAQQTTFNPRHPSCIVPGNFNLTVTCQTCNTPQIINISTPSCYHYGFPFYPFSHCMGFMPVPHFPLHFYPCGLPSSASHSCPPVPDQVPTSTQSTDCTSSSAK